MSKHSTLPTQQQIAEQRARDIARLFARAEKDAEWAKRLDPAAYRCSREAQDGRGCWVWVAEGPAGQVFRFTSDGADGVFCYSQSGAKYHLAIVAEGWFACDCLHAARHPNGCKHAAAWKGILQTHRMEKQGVG